MTTSLLIVATLPCALVLVGCGGSASPASATGTQEQTLRLGATTTSASKVSAISTSNTLSASDTLEVDRVFPTVWRPLSDLTIDDFTVGQEPQNLIDWDTMSYASGPTTNIVGGVRQSRLNVKSSQRATLLDIPTGGPLFLDAGWRSFWSLDLQYGFGEDGPHPLHLQLDGYDRFRVNFEALDAAIDYSMSVVDSSGNRAYSDGIQSTSSAYSAFYTDFLFRDFHAPTPIAWNDIEAIYVNFYTVSPAGGNDVAIASIVVIPAAQ